MLHYDYFRRKFKGTTCTQEYRFVGVIAQEGMVTFHLVLPTLFLISFALVMIVIRIFLCDLVNNEILTNRYCYLSTIVKSESMMPVLQRGDILISFQLGLHNGLIRESDILTGKGTLVKGDIVLLKVSI